VTPGTPLPTPWPKEAFERHSRAIQERRREIRKRNAPEEEMNALFRAFSYHVPSATQSPSNQSRSSDRWITTGKRADRPAVFGRVR
jgi:hypothetical protein